MEGKLNEDGEFLIKRATGWMNPTCPHTNGVVPCGTWCPQFSDPILQKNYKNSRMETVVHICHSKHWKFTAFEDRRGV